MKMMKIVLFASWLLLAPMIVSAQMEHTHSPATAENCTKLSSEMQAVVAAMDGPGLKLEALPRPESSPAIEPGIHKLEVALQPLSGVELVGKANPSRQTPGRDDVMAEKSKPNEKVEVLFGGFIRLTIPKDGLYRISADSTIWIEVIDDGKPIERVRIVPRLHCGRIHKSLGFPLKQEGAYWLEISGSKHRDVAVLVTKEPES